MITLLKIDSVGKIRVINLEPSGSNLKRSTGIYGGNLIETLTPCTAKNVGRSNSTTPEEQVELEIISTVAEKCNEGYVNATEFINLVDCHITLKEFITSKATKAPQAMLAQKYKSDNADYNGGGVMCSAKLDGMRCMSVIPPNNGEIVMWSRGGKRIETMPHIMKELKLLQTTGFVGILDGELYIHDKDADNFQDVMKAIKKYRAGFSELVKYYVYELIDPVMDAMERCRTYFRVIENINSSIIIPVVQLHRWNEESVMECHKEFLEAGYEGTMIKNANSLYQQDKRSSDLLKLKNFQDDEFEVLDVIPMDRKPECGKVVCGMRDKTFIATPKMSYENRKALLTNRSKYIGETATVTFFGYTDDGLPRFPVLKTITRPGDLEDFRTNTK